LKYGTLLWSAATLCKAGIFTFKSSVFIILFFKIGRIYYFKLNRIILVLFITKTRKNHNVSPPYERIKEIISQKEKKKGE
jgi:hypothetical protein